MTRQQHVEPFDRSDVAINGQPPRRHTTSECRRPFASQEKFAPELNFSEKAAPCFQVLSPDRIYAKYVRSLDTLSVVDPDMMRLGEKVDVQSLLAKERQQEQLRSLVGLAEPDFTNFGLQVTDDTLAPDAFPEFESTPHLGVELDNFGPSGFLSDLGMTNYSSTPVLDYCKKRCGSLTSNVSKLCDNCTPLYCSNCQNMACEDGLCQVCHDMSTKSEHAVTTIQSQAKPSSSQPEDDSAWMPKDIPKSPPKNHVADTTPPCEYVGGQECSSPPSSDFDSVDDFDYPVHRSVSNISAHQLVHPGSPIKKARRNTDRSVGTTAKFGCLNLGSQRKVYRPIAPKGSPDLTSVMRSPSLPAVSTSPKSPSVCRSPSQNSSFSLSSSVPQPPIFIFKAQPVTKTSVAHQESVSCEFDFAPTDHWESTFIGAKYLKPSKSTVVKL